ncbi:hypothetical protein [Halopiger djelfimassiliensis]|uniref:hypothetical protein n=1 Tax=Halopiger djelfimassiliensis TaxID=1293047 RepID=UPI000677E9CB|nr:hypothetical protein [Halopiger djelfimassiliensis]
MSEEVPVTRTDVLVLLVVSAVGGLVLAAWMRPVEPSPEFAVSVMSGAVMLTFFLFIPIMGARLFIDDWRN